jgi:chondroitin AC lyase
VKIFPYTPTVTMTTVGVVSDSYVQDTTPTTNYGSDVYLDSKLDPGGINRNIYLKFDLSNIKGTIKQATLFLKPLVIGTTNTIDTANYVSDNSWTESEITWSNAPKATSTLAAGMIYDAASGTFTNFNVGHNAVAGSEYSIQIVGKSPSGSSAYVGFSSKESTAPNAAVPQLFIVSTQ